MKDKTLLKNLENYVSKAWTYLKSDYPYKELKFDHLCYETSSTKKYESFIKKHKEDWEIIKEIPHAGRRLLLVRLKKSVQIDGLTVDILEIQEPKPKGQSEKQGFDHIAFVVDDFEEFYNEVKKRERQVKEVKQIGDIKFFKVIEKDVRLEFKSGSFLADNERLKQDTNEVKEDNVVKSSSDADDEREKRLKLLADFENYKKRAEEEKKQLGLLANATLLNQILDIIDDFDRALETLNLKSEKEIEGLKVLNQKLRSLVEEFGLIEIECKIGDKLNPMEHEAIGTVNVEEEKDKNKVKQIISKGYKFEDGGQVVRATKVIVGKIN